MGYRLGVDLGTTFTAAAMRNGGPPSMLGLGNRALQIPSVLYLQENGQFLVGEAAERRGATDPSRVVREFKRRIGDPIPLMVAGTPFSAQALSARLLASVVATATERRGAAPDEIVLTYPANWGAYKRDLVDQVISLADVGPTVTCPEPQAAAIQYAAQAHLQPGDRVAVYDLGGGTFDVCVLEKTGTGFTILGNPEGIEQLGGVDFDEAVFQHVVGALGPALEQLDLDSPEGRAALTRLRRDCVEAKEALSVDVDTTIPVTLPGRSTSVRLTRAELETLIAPALEQTVEATGRALRTAGTTAEQLTAIVLVGGSSRIPLVSHLLQSRFATPTALDTHPKHDIAMGAVQFSDVAEATTAPLAAVASTNGTAAGTAPGVLPKPTKQPLSAQAKRRIAVLAGGLALLAIGALVGVQLLTGDPSGAAATSGGQPPPTTSAPASSTGTSAPATAPPALRVLPVAPVPLSASELVIPLKTAEGERLYLADATDPDKRTKLSNGPGTDSGPALSPDRRSMIYMHAMAPGNGIPWVSGTDGSGARPLFQKLPTQCADGVTRPAWNAKDPTQLVLACFAGKTTGLYLVNTDGKVLRTLFTAGGEGVGVSDPAVSPDGTRVAFQAQRIPGFGIFVVGMAGKGKPVQLTSGADADPVWSPTAPGVVAYRHAITASSWAIVLVNADRGTVPCAGLVRSNELGGGKQCQVTDGSTLDQDPTWSPAGDQIAFKRNVDAGTGIYVTAASGKGDPRPIWPSSPGNQNAPAWTTR
ncbi:Hsp70 family protein [Streptomyces sp.]|uniref:Hsp70 family protein n=1 Tax=Streptomyces sp. TaxID=1931 RepID=UPI002F950CE8